MSFCGRVGGAHGLHFVESYHRRFGAEFYLILFHTYITVQTSLKFSRIQIFTHVWIGPIKQTITLGLIRHTRNNDHNLEETLIWLV